MRDDCDKFCTNCGRVFDEDEKHWKSNDGRSACYDARECDEYAQNAKKPPER